MKNTKFKEGDILVYKRDSRTTVFSAVMEAHAPVVKELRIKNSREQYEKIRTNETYSNSISSGVKIVLV